jgi:hypothetical protein
MGALATVRVRSPSGGESELALPYLSRDLYHRGLPDSRPKSGAEVAPGIFYVDFDSLSTEQWKPLAPALRSARGLIFDFRGYLKNVAFDVVSHLISAEITEPRLEAPRIDISGRRTSFVSQLHLRPSLPHLDAPVVALIDGQAASAVETIVQMLRDHHLAFFVGELTAGTNGDASTFRVPGGFDVRFTAWRVSSPDGTTIQGHGIAPDEVVHPTLEAVQAGRDEILEAGIAAAQRLRRR